MSGKTMRKKGRKYFHVFKKIFARSLVLSLSDAFPDLFHVTKTFARDVFAAWFVVEHFN